MKELLDKKNVKAPEDFIYATLTDEDIINDAMGIFRQIYPNTIRIDYDNSHTRGDRAGGHQQDRPKQIIHGTDRGIFTG